MSLSAQLFTEAKRSIPGGVNSPVRAFKSVGGEPLFIQRGEGAYLYDMDGKQYIDYVCSWGPLILGHAHPTVLKKVQAALGNGFSFGAPTLIETELAQKIIACMPNIERIRFVSSGTEAVMSAIRVARGFTKRNKVLKFAGCYHGHADSMLVAQGSGGLTFGTPSSAGVPDSVVSDTLVADFNDLEQVADLFQSHPDAIACVIVEPIAGNMNCVLPTSDFLSGLRDLCDQHGALLIFDEVITGFRVGLGGAQAYYQIKPDLTILGKIIGGGFPAAAFGGREEIMQLLSPLGSVYQAGTLSGNPIAMTAGLATLTLLSEPEFYQTLTNKTLTLVNGLVKAAAANHIPLLTATIGGMFGLFFTEQTQIKNESDVKQCQQILFNSFFHGMLARGIYLAPSAFEIGFMSIAHQSSDIEKTIAAANEVFAEIKKV